MYLGIKPTVAGSVHEYNAWFWRFGFCAKHPEIAGIFRLVRCQEYIYRAWSF